jgi:hypothetical protein
MLGDSALLPVTGGKSLKPQGTIQAKQWRVDQKKSVKLRVTFEFLKNVSIVGLALVRSGAVSAVGPSS